MVDAQVSKTCGCKTMWVRSPPSALFSGLTREILRAQFEERGRRQYEVLSDGSGGGNC